MDNDTDRGSRISIDSWEMRISSPSGKGPFPIVFMLHGWTGDEDSMWVFASRFPKESILVSPRGPYIAKRGGYSWYQIKERSSPTIQELRPVIESLSDILIEDNFPTADFSRLALVGFSQGAALAYAFTLLLPERVRNVAGLSGFMPHDAREYIQYGYLEGTRAFIAHGTKDDFVPVELARDAVDILRKAGANVIYCEDDVGHKLSASCFRGLESFFYE